MTIIKTVRIGATQLILDLINKRQSGAPYRWMKSLIDELERTVPADELDDLKAHNLDQVFFTHPHVLSPAEETKEQLDTVRNALAGLKNALPREDVAFEVTASQVKAWRALVRELGV